MPTIRSPVKEQTELEGRTTRSQTNNTTRLTTPPVSNQIGVKPAILDQAPQNPIAAPLVQPVTNPLPETASPSLPKQLEILRTNQTPTASVSNQIDTTKQKVLLTVPAQPKRTKMNTQQIQQHISSSVPEFSGENVTNSTNDLFRFTATADSIYQTLTSDEEKKDFDRLIKLRLTGEAFTRITHRNVNSYPELRELLSNMYSRTYSLEELEKNYNNVKQSYGETVRSYGYRLIEALERYKAGYKSKYKVKQIDEAYVKHLETNSVQIFKRGLNNTILKEKIATFTANSIDNIIKETEAVEEMLATTTSTATPTQVTQVPQPNYIPIPQPITHQITCNFCQRPNHTWDICRTRINQEKLRRTSAPVQSQRPQFQRNHNRTYQPQIRQNQQYSHPAHQNTSYNQRPNRNQYAPTQHPTNFQQNQPGNRFESKYCSYCKIPGHTYDECRSKFFNGNHGQMNGQNNPPPPPTDTGDLSNQFSNMRINTIYPPPPPPLPPPEQYTHQGNANGSNQS